MPRSDRSVTNQIQQLQKGASVKPCAKHVPAWKLKYNHWKKYRLPLIKENAIEWICGIFIIASVVATMVILLAFGA